MKIWRIALKFGPKTPQASNIKTVWGICVFLNWSPGMAFVLVTRVAKFLVIKLDRKIAKQPMGIWKNPHTVLMIDALWMISCSSFVYAVEFDTR